MTDRHKWIGTAASVIAIFAFITGMNNVDDIVGKIKQLGRSKKQPPQTEPGPVPSPALVPEEKTVVGPVPSPQPDPNWTRPRSDGPTALNPYPTTLPRRAPMPQSSSWLLQPSVRSVSFKAVRVIDPSGYRAGDIQIAGVFTPERLLGQTIRITASFYHLSKAPILDEKGEAVRASQAFWGVTSSVEKNFSITAPFLESQARNIFYQVEIFAEGMTNRRLYPLTVWHPGPFRTWIHEPSFHSLIPES